MKILDLLQLPKPYDQKCVVVCEEVFIDRNTSETRPYAKPYIVPLNAIKDVAVGDEVRPLFNRFNKIEMFQKV